MAAQKNRAPAKASPRQVGRPSKYRDEFPEQARKLKTLVEQGLQGGIRQRNDLGDFVRGAEAIEKMQHRDAPGERGGRGDGCHVLRLLDRIGGEEGEAGAARRHHVGVVAENG